LVTALKRWESPVDKHNCPWKVYGPDGQERDFWDDNGMPSIQRGNAFVHATALEWKTFDKSTKSKTLTITEVTDCQIRNNRIRESLVHELLKMILAREGWWVNFEVPINGGRIDFLVRQSATHPWTVIEVKLGDNPDAVEQLHTYIKHIKRDVKRNKGDSYFWPLWDGGKRWTKPKGVVLCAYPSTETVHEVKVCNYGYEVWTYEYNCEDNKLGMVIRDSKGRLIARTR
jgi:hypothetical protein